MTASADAPAPNAGDEENAAPETPRTDPVRRLVRRVALLHSVRSKDGGP
jgi:hypothetical protein